MAWDGPAPWSAAMLNPEEETCSVLVYSLKKSEYKIDVILYSNSPRGQSPKQGLDVVAMADSVLLIYLESARPKVKTTFTFCPMRHESKTKYCRLLKNLPNTEYVQ